MTPLPILLTLAFCFGGPRCVYSRPVPFPTFAACAQAGAAMMDHAREVAMGDVSFTCATVGG